MAPICENLSEFEQKLEVMHRVSELIPIAIYGCDREGRILFFNSAAVGLWKRVPLTRNHHNKFCGSFKLYSPDGKLLPHEQSAMAVTLRTKKPVVDHEVIIERPDKSFVSVIANTALLQKKDGRLVGAINCLVDITERRLMAERLKESEERFRQLSEAATQGILIHKDRKFVDCNSACEKMFGYTRSELIGMDTIRLVAPESRKMIAEIIRNRSEEKYEFMALRKNGEKFPASGHGSNSIYYGVNVRVVVFTDLTERKKMEKTWQMMPARLIAAEEKERCRVSRELHDSVTQLLSSAHFRMESLWEEINLHPVKAKHDISIAKKMLQKALDEVRRISHNLRPSELDDLGLSGAVRSLLSEFGERAKITIKASIAEVSSSPQTELVLYRMLQEALSNVEKHSKASKLSVRLVKNRKFVSLTVSDNGSCSSLRPKKKNGKNGLGFQGMRERVELVGGTFSVSQEVGKGFTVSARIPLQAVPSAETT